MNYSSIRGRFESLNWMPRPRAISQQHTSRTTRRINPVFIGSVLIKGYIVFRNFWQRRSLLLVLHDSFMCQSFQRINFNVSANIYYPVLISVHILIWWGLLIIFFYIYLAFGYIEPTDHFYRALLVPSSVHPRVLPGSTFFFLLERNYDRL